MEKTITGLNVAKSFISKGIYVLATVREKAKQNKDNKFQSIFIEKEWFLAEFKKLMLEDPNKTEYTVVKKYEHTFSKDEEEIVDLLNQYFKKDWHLGGVEVNIEHSYGATWDDEDPYDYITVTISFQR